MKRKKRKHISDEALDAAIDSALLKSHWRVPASEDEVAEAETWLENTPIELPEALQTPTPIEKLEERELTVEPLACSENIEENLSRAAREGGKLTPEIEEVMKRDREKAEADLIARKRGKKR